METLELAIAGALAFAPISGQDADPLEEVTIEFEFEVTGSRLVLSRLPDATPGR